jgi:hypothetical protein
VELCAASEAKRQVSICRFELEHAMGLVQAANSGESADGA